MVLTPMGSAYSPHTGEGRALCLILAVYGFTVFGYVTATLATFFVARDVEDGARETVAPKAVEAPRHEILALRAEMRGLVERLAPDHGGASTPPDQ